MKHFIIFTIIIAAFLISSLSSYSQNINKPNIYGPLGLQVNTFSGNLFYTRTDLFIPCRGFPIDLTFYYNSAATLLDFGYGRGWSMTYNMVYERDTVGTDKIILMRNDGREEIYSSNNAIYTAPVGIFDSLIEYQPSKFKLRTKSGINYFFDDSSHKRLTKISDPNVNELTLSYTDSLITTITDPSGRSVQLNYANSHLINITDPNTVPVRHITFQNDSLGNPRTVMDPLGNSISYEYGPGNALKKIFDQASNQFDIGYENFFQVFRVTSPLNNIHINFDSTELKTTVIEMVGGVKQSSSYKYNKRGNLDEKIENCCGFHEVFRYDSVNNMNFKENANGDDYIYHYDGRGNITQVIDPLNGVATIAYEPIFNRITSFTDKRGNTTTFKYDIRGNLLCVNKPGNISSCYTYDNFGNVTSYTNGRGFTTQYQYNIHGDRILVTFPSGTTNNSFVYDNVGNLIRYTDANMHTTNYEYDLLNRLIKITDANGDMTTFMYDSRSNISSVRDIYGQTISYTYDALNRRKTITNPVGTSSFFYDEKGNLVKKIDNNGFITIYTYNTQNLLVSVTNPLGDTRYFMYDDEGNLISETDFNGHVTTYRYDDLSRLKEIIDRRSYSTVFNYDANGNLITITDANNNATNFQYDALNRRTNEIYANGTMKKYTYDGADNIITRTDGNGLITSYNYDPRDRLTSRGSDNYTYDNEFNVRTANNSNASITRFYDNVNRISSENINGKTTTYSYNIPGRTRTIIYPGGRTIEENYDIRLRLLRVREGGTNIAVYSYDEGDRTLTRTYSNGVLADYDYNQNNWETKLSHTKGSDTVAIFNYTFDKNGNRLSAEKLHRLTNSEKYLYYNDDQLSNYKEGILVGKEIPDPLKQIQYNYDGVGNRTYVVSDLDTITYTRNNVNGYISIVDTITITPTYDLNGNTLNDGIHSYSYDFENRLVAVDAGISASYKYDALGRRIQKIAAAGTINYYYDNQRVIEERDASDIVKATYVYGTWIDDILNMRRNDNNYFYHQSSLASVAAVTDNLGSVVERYEYDGYGNLTIYDGSYALRNETAIGNTYMFTGREFDAETDNYHYRARYYRSGWGRFGQWDPIRFSGGDVNLYRYCKNNPVNYVDPSGLQQEPDLGPAAQDVIDKYDKYNQEPSKEYPILKLKWDEIEVECKGKKEREELWPAYWSDFNYSASSKATVTYDVFTADLSAGVSEGGVFTGGFGGRLSLGPFELSGTLNLSEGGVVAGEIGCIFRLGPFDLSGNTDVSEGGKFGEEYEFNFGIGAKF